MTLEMAIGLVCILVCICPVASAFVILLLRGGPRYDAPDDPWMPSKSWVDDIISQSRETGVK